MTVDVVGNYPILQRARTGLFSLDMAMRGRPGELGYPLRSIVELYGRPESGKSTLGYYLAGKITEKGKIYLCDVDKMVDTEYLKSATEVSGFDGSIHIVDMTDKKGKPIPHEIMTMEMANALSEEDVGAVLLDSVGGVTPMVELEEGEEFGQAFMGKRAKLVAQVVRALTLNLRNKERPSTAIAINHVHNVIGGRGHTTPGGEVLKFKAISRIMIWTQETFRDNDDEILGFLVKGALEKHTFGGKGRSFTYYIVPGLGVHPGASAMFDCVTYGLATREARVKLGDKNIGYLKADLLDYAREGKKRKFDVFVDALQEYENTLMKEGMDAGDTSD